MILSFHIVELLKQKCGNPLRLPSDVERLTLDIESATGEHVGTNTMKRLLGLINDERTPRTSTLDVIARYLGYVNWDVLQQLEAKSNSAFGDTDNHINTEEMPIGQMLRISYQPNRQLIIKHQGGTEFLITASINSKLHVGDIITLAHVVDGYPLLVTDVIRDGESLGAFTAGKVQGIHYELI